MCIRDRLNPKLVYCSITGFGQDGPYAARAGYDFLIQGMGGLMSVTGRSDGEPGGGPMKVGVALTDILTGLGNRRALDRSVEALDGVVRKDPAYLNPATDLLETGETR